MWFASIIIGIIIIIISLSAAATARHSLPVSFFRALCYRNFSELKFSAVTLCFIYFADFSLTRFLLLQSCQFYGI